MITLNTERGLVNIENWQDVLDLPGYQSELSLTEHTLDSVIGRYVEKDWVKCGLTNCHTLHSKGWVVKTKKGPVTNIGKDCAKTHLGVDFDAMAKQFDRNVTMQNNRSLLASFSFQIDDFETKIEQIREGRLGADWIYKKSRPLITPNSGCPNEVVKSINSMVKSSSNLLTKSRLASKEEVDRAIAAKGGAIQQPYYVDEPVAEIKGLQVLRSENDLKVLLITDIKENITAFKSKNIDSLSFEELRHWSKWVASLDNKLEVIASAIDSGKVLLTRENLEPFNEVLDHKDKAVFKTYLKSLD